MWPVFLLHLAVPLAATAEIVFLVVYIWWSSGGGPPTRTQLARRLAFRRTVLTPEQWFWGLRGYMQQPIERRHGAAAAIIVSTFFFTLVHLTKAWSMLGMIPIVFGAGVLLGLLAWSSQSLIPSTIGHVVMDIGLFAYWWTGIAGEFTSRPISETGVDQPFLIACVLLAIALVIVLLAIRQLTRIRVSNSVAA